MTIVKFPDPFRWLTSDYPPRSICGQQTGGLAEYFHTANQKLVSEGITNSYKLPVVPAHEGSKAMYKRRNSLIAFIGFALIGTVA